MYCIKELKRYIPVNIDDYSLILLRQKDIEWYIKFFMSDYFNKYQDDKTNKDANIEEIKFNLVNQALALKTSLKINGEIRLILIDRNNSSPVGGCTIYESGGNCAELGYWILSSYSGKGIGNKLVSCISKIVLSLSYFDNIKLEIRCDNIASICIAEKCGFELVDKVEGKYGINFIYICRGESIDK